MMSFPGVSSLETPRSAWSRSQAATGPGQPPQPRGLGGVGVSPGLSAPRRPAVPLLFPRAALEIPRWRFPARGGSEFPWPPSGSVSFSPGSSVPFAPRGHSCAHSVGQPSAPVGAGRSRAYLPQAVWKPTGASTPRGTQGQVESGVCLAARVGRGVVCSSSVRVCFLLCLRRPRWMRCDPGLQAWAVQIKSS